MLFATLVFWLIFLAGCFNRSEESHYGGAGLQCEGIDRFAKVSDQLYRGSQPTEVGYYHLRRMGVKSIVSLRVWDRSPDGVPEWGFRLFHVSMKLIHPEDEDAVEFLKIVTDPKNQPVFVHCREGVDRTGMMVAVYRIMVQGWSNEAALAEMKQMGFNRINMRIEGYIEDLDRKKLQRLLEEATTPVPENENETPPVSVESAGRMNYNHVGRIGRCG